MMSRKCIKSVNGFVCFMFRLRINNWLIVRANNVVLCNVVGTFYCITNMYFHFTQPYQQFGFNILVKLVILLMIHKSM
jgi:hypothetical protein